MRSRCRVRRFSLKQCVGRPFAERLSVERNLPHVGALHDGPECRGVGRSIQSEGIFHPYVAGGECVALHDVPAELHGCLPRVGHAGMAPEPAVGLLIIERVCPCIIVADVAEVQGKCILLQRLDAHFVQRLQGGPLRVLGAFRHGIGQFLGRSEEQCAAGGGECDACGCAEVDGARHGIQAVEVLAGEREVHLCRVAQAAVRYEEQLAVGILAALVIDIAAAPYFYRSLGLCLIECQHLLGLLHQDDVGMLYRVEQRLQAVVVSAVNLGGEGEAHQAPALLHKGRWLPRGSPSRAEVPRSYRLAGPRRSDCRSPCLRGL